MHNNRTTFAALWDPFPDPKTSMIMMMMMTNVVILTQVRGIS